MNWKKTASNWSQARGRIGRQWRKLTKIDLDAIAGHRHELISRIQDRYDISERDAEKRVDSFASHNG